MMTAQPAWGQPVGGGRGDLDQVLRDLPQKEQRQLAEHAERMGLAWVAAAAGPETVWGVASCRNDSGAGVLALTDDHLLICLFNGQVPGWQGAVALREVGAVEFEPGGLGQAGCVASVAYGEAAVLGLIVGRDTDYAAAFLRMIAEQVDEVGADQTAAPVAPFAPVGQPPVPVGGPQAAFPPAAPFVPPVTAAPGAPQPQLTPGAPQPQLTPGVPQPQLTPGVPQAPFPPAGPMAGAPAPFLAPGGQAGVAWQPAGPDELLAQLVRAGLERQCPGRWRDWQPGVCSVVCGAVGLLVQHSGGKLSVTSYVLSGLQFSAELVTDLGEVNAQSPIGGFYLRPEASTGQWHLVYGYALFGRWLLPPSPASAQLLSDVLAHAPATVEWAAERLRSQRGGVRPAVGDAEGWQAATVALR